MYPSAALRDAARDLWRVTTGAAVLATLPLRSRANAPRVFYGGARSGDVGGPLVKVRLLSERFPEHRIGYSIVYLLSNAIYLPQWAVDAIHQAQIPIVLNQNGVFYPAWYPDRWEQENARMARVHAAASHVFYQSEFCRLCADRFLGHRTGPAEILYNAVDTARFTPERARRAARPFTFLVTGKITEATAYRVTAAIQGLAAARKGGLDAALRISGVLSPAVAAAAEALAARLDMSGRITFTGPYSGAEAPGIYRSADAYLMLKHNDPCPNVVIEAMASGLPVLYSASGGVPELVGEHAGLGLAVRESFDAASIPAPEAIAEGMGRVIANCDAMGAAARRRAEAHFDLSSWLDRHEKLFAELTRARA